MNKTCAGILFVVYFFSSIYFGFLFVGLRYTNHDDIFLQLTSYVHAGNFLDFASYAAYAHYRIQAFVNMPIILWIDSLVDTVWYDVANLTVYILLIHNIITFLSHIAPSFSRISFLLFFTLLYPLHYYFTFPQSYPVMAAWPLLFLFISLNIFLTHKAFSYLSCFLFTTSLLGPEYNFILHPLMLFAVVCIKKKRIKLLIPYALGYVVYAVLYISFAQHAKLSAMDTVGRMSLQFDLYDWVNTFFVLVTKSFLPIALMFGVKTQSNPELGGLEVPSLLTYSTLIPHINTFGVIFGIFAFAACIFIFAKQKISLRDFYLLSTFSVVFSVIPSIIVAASSHYQEIVLRGYIQGHLVSFYSLFGFTLLLFLFFSFILNGIRNDKVRVLALCVSSGFCAICFVYTYTYNILNRDMMNVNSSKWKAVELVAAYIYEKSPEMKGKKIRSDVLWTTMGVSSIPAVSPFTGKNYWTEYSELVLKKPLSFVQHSTEGDVIVQLKATPTYDPIVIISDKSFRDNSVYLSYEPLALTIHTDDSKKVSVSLLDWICKNYCYYLSPKVNTVSRIEFSLD